VKRAVGLCTFIFLFAGALSAQAPAPPNTVMKAMGDELQRSVSELQFKDLEKPYFIQYIILDREQYQAEATFGGLTASKRDRARLLQAQVRVGDYDFDNSEFIAQGFQPQSGILTTTVIEDDYDGIRHSLWLATDAAYKQSVEQLARKRAFVQNKVRDEQIPDFSMESAVTSVGSPLHLEFDKAVWERQLRDWSSMFREFPSIQESSVSLRALVINKYLVNSEGTRTLQPSMIVMLQIEAKTEAEDGMRLVHSIPFNAASFSQLPAKQMVDDAIRRMGADLTALRTAPIFNKDYSGPVLLTGQASAEMFARVLAPNLSGQRLPLSERELAQGQTTFSELVERMNRPVLPPFLSVFDDPAQSQIGSQELIGHYQVDDQGVRAQRVSLIEEGVLRSFLMSRRPTKELPRSNGHGRSGFPGRETAQIGNLFVQSNEGKSYDELKQELIKSCKREQLQFCLLVKGLTPDGRSPIGVPVLTYKVYVDDGREELVRGASASAIPIRSLREIEAVGNDTFVANRLGGSADVPTPMSVVAPSVLLEEMDLKRPPATQQKPALLTHPYFSRN
jgi:TldD protein